MSKIKKVFKSVTSILGLSAPDVKIPEAVVPAAPAPTTRTDTGAQINLGSSAIADQRVSGGGNSSIGTQVDVLGGLSLGGLRV